MWMGVLEFIIKHLDCLFLFNLIFSSVGLILVSILIKNCYLCYIDHK